MNARTMCTNARPSYMTRLSLRADRAMFTFSRARRHERISPEYIHFSAPIHPRSYLIILYRICPGPLDSDCNGRLSLQWPGPISRRNPINCSRINNEMSLPPALLARLKRRKIIQDVSDEAADTSPAKRTQDQSLSPSNRAADEVGQGLPDDEPKEEILAEDYSEDDSSDKRDADSERSDNDDSDDGAGDVGADGEQDPSRHQDHNDDRPQDGPARFRQADNETFRRQVSLASLVARGESVMGCPNKYNVYHTCGQYCMDNYGDPKTTEPTLEQRKQLASILKTYPLPDDWVVVFEPGVNTFYFWNILTNLVTWYPPTMNVFPSLSANQIRKFMQNMDGAQTVMPE